MQMYIRIKPHRRYQATQENVVTHAAVAPKTSCLLALVDTLSTKLKNSVKSTIMMILMEFKEGTSSSSATGTIKSTTASKHIINRTRMLIRALL